MPLVASAARYTFADARLFEHAFSPGSVRIAERPRGSRPSVAVTLALPPSASILDFAASPPPALAASAAASQASHAALQIAAYGSSVRSTKAPRLRLSQLPCPTPLKPPAEQRPRAMRPRPEAMVMQLSRLADPQATWTMILKRRNLTRRLISSAKVNS